MNPTDVIIALAIIGGILAASVALMLYVQFRIYKNNTKLTEDLANLYTPGMLAKNIENAQKIEPEDETPQPDEEES